MDLRNNRKTLQPNDINDPYFTRHIIDQLPVLSRSRPVVARSVDSRRSKKGERYLSLRVGDKDARKLVGERDEIWQELEKMSGANKLKWHPYVPDMLVAMIGADVPRTAAQHIAAYIPITARDHA